MEEFKEILVGEAEEARVVEDGGVLAESALLPGDVEGGGNAIAARRGIDVAMAEREGVDGVRDGANGGFGE